MDLHEQTISFCVKWNQFAATLSIPTLQGGIEALKTIERTALTTKKAHRLGTRLDGLLLLKAEEVFETPPSEELLGSSSDLDRVRQHLLKHLTRSELAQAAASLSVLQEKTVDCSGPATDLLRHFIECELGNGAIDPNRIAPKFAGIRGEIQRIKNLSVEISTVRDFAKRIEGAGAAKLASRLISAPAEQVGEDTIIPANWREAWNWARIKGHLDEIESRNELVAMAARRRDLEIALSRLYKNSVAKSAWLATKKNSTQRVLQALAGYATAIRRIGQGTGPNAMRYRRDARAAMLEAAGAVPCWIMRHAKISESMPAEIGVFDLVIVDEASQSDLWALPAILRGKKILVVGDDKQVSPDPGFIASQKITELRNRFLSDQPYGVEMTPEKSLYDLAARVFAAEQVMLREHFRCVPPIISYSNRNFYNGAIQPIRIPRASERIDPPLVDIYVEDGFRDLQDRNGREAEVIAEEIGAILENKRLAGRTIGAVSLLGMDQAKHIDDLVRRNFSATDLLSRKFECGDARTFQGSERDIIFLSMVVDPRNCKAISGNMFEQRFNVAASRARDRMYLVRSVTSSLLSDRDLRISLLRHFDRPLAVGNEEAESLASLCESGFERDLYTELTGRGFRVVPQVKTGAFRIDMVVEGVGDTRLAIECDGDEFHGPDRWQHDMNRQRVLERAGWTFWRCFASTWLLHRFDTIGDLLTQLSAMGIEPMGALERIPSLVERRTSKHLVSENDPVEDTIRDAIKETKSHSRGTA